MRILLNNLVNVVILMSYSVYMLYAIQDKQFASDTHSFIECLVGYPFLGTV
jgi:hypothetical protein